MLTELFRSGDSQAVRIPKELAFPADWNEVVVERQGDALVLRPVRRRMLTDVAQKFSAFPAGFMSEGREAEAEIERKGQ
ncbi:MAG: type II toxin-antitoxin system VapB family antitoxin [Hyphomonadaceae bacterium]